MMEENNRFLSGVLSDGGLENEYEVTPNEPNSATVNSPAVKDNKRFKCKFCKKGFDKASVVREHERIHTGDKPYQCPKCPKSFTQSGTLRSHMFTHTGETPYKCTVCSKNFQNAYNLKNHSLLHEGKFPFECSICFKGLRSSTSLSAHMRIHKNEYSYECPFCKKKFKRKPAYSYHLLTHTGEKPHFCKYCPKSFRCDSSLKSHELFHTGVKHFKCSLCPEGFKRSEQLKVHNRVHTGEKSEQCPSSFKQSTAFIQHISSLHNNIKFKKCHLCPAVFTTITSLNKHLKLCHTGKHPYQCDQCSLTLRNKEQFYYHQRKHLQIRPKPSKSFFQTKHLHMHLKSDADKTPVTFICSNCQLVFQTYFEYEKHIITHDRWACCCCLQEFPDNVSLENHCLTCHIYKCEGCLTEFNSREEIKEHICTHIILLASSSDSSPHNKSLSNDEEMDIFYKCEFCTKAFQTLSERAEHALVHDEWACNSCLVEFSTNAFLEEHCVMCNGPSIPVCLASFVNPPILGNVLNRKEEYCHRCEKQFPDYRTHSEHVCGCEKAHFNNHNNNATKCFNNNLQNNHNTNINYRELGKKSNIKNPSFNETRSDDSETGADQSILNSSLDKNFTQVTMSKSANLTNAHACPHCPTAFLKLQKLTSQVLSHPKPLKCPLCPKSFSTATGLIHHKKLHNKKLPNATNDQMESEHGKECTILFSYNDNIASLNKNHKKKEHVTFFKEDSSEAQQLHPNPSSQKLSLEKSLPSSTRMTRSKSGNLSSAHCCPHCSQVFYKLQELTDHLIVHTKPFKCSICDKSFSTSSGLNFHKKSHNNSTFVQKSVESNNSLNTLRGHTDDCLSTNAFNYVQIPADDPTIPYLNSRLVDEKPCPITLFTSNNQLMTESLKKEIKEDNSCPLFTTSSDIMSSLPVIIPEQFGNVSSKFLKKETRVANHWPDVNSASDLLTATEIVYGESKLDLLRCMNNLHIGIN